jgi:flagellar motor switch protein FliN/FliY
VAQMQDRRQKKNDEKKAVDLKAARFQSFDQYKEDTAEKLPQQNIDLIIDVPLQVTVVLGKSRKSIREILKMGMGSVIVLDRLAGEMVDILVNGKIFAHGEVVVIDDNYGVRITEMVPGQINI